MLLLLACAAPEPAVVTFSLNVHDWVLVEDSARTMEAVLDLHEAAGVPVDVFLTDPVARAYEREAPEVLARLRDAPLVATSYHVRPPAPYYPGFDWLGYDAMDDDDQERLIAEYETHAIDLGSGETTAEPGGYAYVETLVGAPPWAIGPGVSDAREPLMVDLGATFEVDHSDTHDLGETSSLLYYRPEHVEVKLYEYVGDDPCAVIAAAEADGAYPTSGPRFVNVKWHENDLYARGIPWRSVYFEDDVYGDPLPPPWDVADWDRGTGPIVATGQAERLDFYAASLRCVLDAPERYTAMNLADVATLLEEG